MRRLSAIDLQERLRARDVSVVCVSRRRAPSVDDVVRRLDGAARRLGLDLFTVDGDDGETAALLPDLGVAAVPCVLVISSGVLLERVSTVRDNVDARRLMAMAAASRPTLLPGAASSPPTSSPPATSPPTSSPPATSPPASATEDPS
jgi:hypothetical protein